MTISFDSPASTNGKGASGGSRLDNDSSGETLGWLKGVEGLWRSVGGSENVSGAVLTRVIEQEIIPRLFIAHQGASTASTSDDISSFVDINDTDAFAELVLTSEASEIMRHVQTLIDQGIGRQRIYLDLFAPVARRLGEFWEEDRCTFVDVSLGLSRLQRVLRELSRRKDERASRTTPKRCVYLVPAPGEQQTFGLSLVEEFFIEAGWQTASDHAASEAEILQTVFQQKFDVIGFSLSSERFLDPVSRLIAQLRKASRNRDVPILVCGRLLIDHPELASRIEGAVFPSDEVTAVDRAEALIGHKRRLAAAHRQP